jgi:hypothetical protein
MEKPMTTGWHQINWDSLWYGDWEPANDRSISKMIRWALDSLSSTMPGKWVGAIDWMKWNFLSIGEPHPVFVPFLLELLESPQTRCRGRILDWLGCLCMSKEVFAKEEVKSTRDLLAETRRTLWSGLDTFLGLLGDGRASVRTSAPFPAAMLLDACRGHLPWSLLTTDPEARIAAALDKRLDVETHPVAKSSVIIATGYAAKHQPQLILRLRALHSEESNPSVRLASAMALAVCDPDIPNEALHDLVSELQDSPGDCIMCKHFSTRDDCLEERHNPLVKAYAGLSAPIGPAAGELDDAGAFEDVLFPWTDPDWPVLTALRAMCLVKLSNSQSVLHTVTHAVSVCHDHQSMDVLEPILPAVFQGKKLSPEAKRADLTEFEYAVLRAIYDNPLLWPGANTFSAYRSVGLPMHRRDWRQLLEIKDVPTPDWYYERLARRENSLSDNEPVTEEHYRQVTSVFLYHMVDNRYIPPLARFPTLEYLQIDREVYGVEDGFAIDGEGLSQLPLLPKLTHLHIRGVNIVDIPQIERCHALEQVDLAGTNIADSFIRRLRGFPKVRRLYLWGTRITDDCLEVLPSLPALISLDVPNTAISDEGVEMMVKLSALQSLGIERTKITEDGYRRLQCALPRCKIEWSPPR